jgi:hypothetical protein
MRETFVSETIEPQAASFDTAAMGRGLPGLPEAFTWREQTLAIVSELESWKQSAPEGGRASGERYLRRHYYRLRMADESIWTVYFMRQGARGAGAKRRWILYSIAQPQ